MQPQRLRTDVFCFGGRAARNPRAFCIYFSSMLFFLLLLYHWTFAIFYCRCFLGCVVGACFGLPLVGRFFYLARRVRICTRRTGGDRRLCFLSCPGQTAVEGSFRAGSSVGSAVQFFAWFVSTLQRVSLEGTHHISKPTVQDWRGFSNDEYSDRSDSSCCMFCTVLHRFFDTRSAVRSVKFHGTGTILSCSVHGV